MVQVNRLNWSQLTQAPNTAGVYAWYFRPQITEFDLERAISEIHSFIEANQTESAKAVVRTLLNENVMSYYRQDPYDMVLTGPLKPRHTGTAFHDQQVSDSLVIRILENPERLRPLREFLANSAPDFASPLYVGMSDQLRTRLWRHRTLIEKYRAFGFRRDSADESEKSEDSGFARRIVDRKIPPDSLFVQFYETDALSGLHVDAENLLNRIYYPILGRN